MEQQDSTLVWLDDQLQWYDKSAGAARKKYARLKVLELVVAAAVPVLAGLAVPAAVTATAAAVVVVLEGLQQLFQWNTNWVQYRTTSQALTSEKYLYLAQAGPYTGADRLRLLTERIDALMSKEGAAWTRNRQRPPRGEANQAEATG